MTQPIRPPMLNADMIRELLTGFTTTETIRRPTQHDDGRWYTENTLHTVTHPGLLDQINDTVQGRTGNGEIFHAAYGSKPAGRIDCLAYLERLGKESKTLAAAHNIPTLPLRDRLQRISGAIGDTTTPTIKSWWVTARVLTQHDSPPFTPPVPCPIEECERRGTLRVRLSQEIAVCTECRNTWTGPDYNLLAIWCAWAAEHLKGPRHWLTDDDGFPTECTECLATRQQMATRRDQRRTSNGESSRVAS